MGRSQKNHEDHTYMSKHGKKKSKKFTQKIIGNREVAPVPAKRLKLSSKSKVPININSPVFRCLSNSDLNKHETANLRDVGTHIQGGAEGREDRNVKVGETVQDFSESRENEFPPQAGHGHVRYSWTSSSPENTTSLARGMGAFSRNTLMMDIDESSQGATLGNQLSLSLQVSPSSQEVLDKPQTSNSFTKYLEMTKSRSTSDVSPKKSSSDTFKATGGLKLKFVKVNKDNRMEYLVQWLKSKPKMENVEQLDKVPGLGVEKQVIKNKKKSKARRRLKLVHVGSSEEFKSKKQNKKIVEIQSCEVSSLTEISETYTNHEFDSADKKISNRHILAQKPAFSQPPSSFPVQAINPNRFQMIYPATFTGSVKNTATFSGSLKNTETFSGSVKTSGASEVQKLYDSNYQPYPRSSLPSTYYMNQPILDEESYCPVFGSHNEAVHQQDSTPHLSTSFTKVQTCVLEQLLCTQKPAYTRPSTCGGMTASFSQRGPLPGQQFYMAPNLPYQSQKMIDIKPINSDSYDQPLDLTLKRATRVEVDVPDYASHTTKMKEGIRAEVAVHDHVKHIEMRETARPEVDILDHATHIEMRETTRAEVDVLDHATHIEMRETTRPEVDVLDHATHIEMRETTRPEVDVPVQTSYIEMKEVTRAEVSVPVHALHTTKIKEATRAEVSVPDQAIHVEVIEAARAEVSVPDQVTHIKVIETRAEVLVPDQATDVEVIEAAREEMSVPDHVTHVKVIEAAKAEVSVPDQATHVEVIEAARAEVLVPDQATHVEVIEAARAEVSVHDQVTHVKVIEAAKAEVDVPDHATHGWRHEVNHYGLDMDDDQFVAAKLESLSSSGHRVQLLRDTLTKKEAAITKIRQQWRINKH